jgi:hypothetical protein
MGPIDVFKSRMGDEQTGYLSRTVFQEIGSRLAFPISACRPVRTLGSLILFQPVVTMSHKMAQAKEAEIDRGNGALRTLSRVARNRLSSGRVRVVRVMGWL